MAQTRAKSVVGVYLLFLNVRMPYVTGLTCRVDKIKSRSLFSVIHFSGFLLFGLKEIGFAPFNYIAFYRYYDDNKTTLERGRPNDGIVIKTLPCSMRCWCFCSEQPQSVYRTRETSNHDGLLFLVIQQRIGRRAVVH
ncbi:hypothetical protein B0T13DRAFT_34904 [Neurospora crassa]|nr:hypothetical protein B0T13DRAFT_34904 [Neurospora crassa]